MFCRRTLVSLLLAPALCGVLGAQPAPTVEIFTPYEPDETGVELLPPGPPGGADALTASASCHETLPRAAIVGLRWSTAETGTGSTQRVDISKYRDGFSTGQFSTSRLLPAATTAVGIEAPEPGIHYYWLVVEQGGAVRGAHLPLRPSGSQSVSRPRPPGL